MNMTSNGALQGFGKLNNILFNTNNWGSNRANLRTNDALVMVLVYFRWFVANFPIKFEPENGTFSLFQQLFGPALSLCGITGTQSVNNCLWWLYQSWDCLPPFVDFNIWVRLDSGWVDDIDISKALANSERLYQGRIIVEPETASEPVQRCGGSRTVRTLL